MTISDDIPLESIRKLVNYLEYDEANHFFECAEDPDDKELADGHIYRHVRAVALWLRGRGVDVLLQEDEDEEMREIFSAPSGTA